MREITELTQRYVAAFEAFAGNGAGAAPPWRSSVSRR